MLTEDLELYIIEIPKSKRILERENENKIAQWMAFLDNPNSKEVSEIMGKNNNIKEAMKELEEMSEDEELRRVAELKEKYERDERSRIESAKEDGYNIGIEKRKQRWKSRDSKKYVKKGNINRRYNRNNRINKGRNRKNV